MRTAFVLVFAACAHTAVPPPLDDRVDERARAIDPHATKVGELLHGEKSQNDGSPELEWSVTLDAGCYWLIAVGEHEVTSLQSKLEGRAVVSTENEYCVPMSSTYRVTASAGGHGAVALGVYRKTSR